MPHSPQFKAAGIAILQFAYRACEEHEVPKHELPELFNSLSLAVAEGQGIIPANPSSKHETLPRIRKRVTEEILAQIRQLHAEGLGYDRIGQRLGIPKTTVAKRLSRPHEPKRR
jgi:DNA invertase Pin-like site-specific DNA recombinase